jgi:hypothetical protein
VKLFRTQFHLETPPADSERVRDVLLWKLLLLGSTTRRELGESTGVSLASISNQIRWLMEEGFLVTRRFRTPNAKRPTEELQIAPQRGQGAILSLRLDRVVGELLWLDSMVASRVEEPVAEASQRGVCDALGRAAAKLHAAAEQPIAVAVLAASGCISNEDGIIFTFDGLPDWEPCQPWLVLPEVRRFARVSVFTNVMCKLHGLAAALKQDDQIAYAEYERGQFQVASLRNGRPFLGYHGTRSAYLHQSVSETGPVCYCGRRGCLSQLLREGRADPAVLAKAFVRFAKAIRVRNIGLEWTGAIKPVASELQRAGVSMHAQHSAEEMLFKGLRMLAAEAAIHQAIEDEELAAKPKPELVLT